MSARPSVGGVCLMDTFFSFFFFLLSFSLLSTHVMCCRTRAPHLDPGNRRDTDGISGPRTREQISVGMGRRVIKKKNVFFLLNSNFDLYNPCITTSINNVVDVVQVRTNR